MLHLFKTVANKPILGNIMILNALLCQLLSKNFMGFLSSSEWKQITRHCSNYLMVISHYLNLILADYFWFIVKHYWFIFQIHGIGLNLDREVNSIGAGAVSRSSIVSTLSNEVGMVPLVTTGTVAEGPLSVCPTVLDEQGPHHAALNGLGGRATPKRLRYQK